ncbi:hypothetical protein [Chenggangzhangella methanolivorans]|uniref:Uncharacterized protein n=1 Tax=Chenggangzhangella methanolivorans TaxID=1437009 RepID=A0A9E6RDK5_9HYPH|nr:hypothetical protein [Chenggangzhangella methanolivorans]QZO01374.1 hypothetical protein K6K41_07895 [Chenggangzhangella methanolivorans]
MIEALVRFVAGVLWEFILYGTGRLALAALSFGRAWAEAMQGERTEFPWHGFGRDASGLLVMSQTWTGLIGGSVWMSALFALLVALGRI